MKKVFIGFVLCFMCFFTLSCDNTTTKESLLSIYTTTVESDLALFTVSIDYAEINSSIGTVTVTVEITAKVDIDQELGTSSYGDLGIIDIRVLSIVDAEIGLYSEFYDVPVTEDMYFMHMDANDTLIRTMKFARMPFHGGAGGEQPSPTGTYKVQLRLMVSDTVWIDTEITISVID